MPALGKVTFQPNVPVRRALKFSDGKTVEGPFGEQEYYTLADGRCMYLDLDVATKLNVLELQPGEPFEICKFWSGKKGDKPQWDVRRVALKLAISSRPGDTLAALIRKES